jgi:hypothetical protein
MVDLMCETWKRTEESTWFPNRISPMFVSEFELYDVW